jgi:hypothetical protein
MPGTSIRSFTIAPSKSGFPRSNQLLYKLQFVQQNTLLHLKDEIHDPLTKNYMIRYENVDLDPSIIKLLYLQENYSCW